MYIVSSLHFVKFMINKDDIYIRTIQKVKVNRRENHFHRK